MSRKNLLIGLGTACAAVGGFLFARFWILAGTETPPGESGMLSNLDWGTFFVSPLLFIGGFVLVLWGFLSDSAQDDDASPSPEQNALTPAH